MAVESYSARLEAPKSIFRAYDIRGIVDEDLTPEIVYHIALAIGSEAQSLGEKSIIVARDCRLSSPELSKTLVQGLLNTGCDVIDIGTVPTPVLYFATHTLAFKSGVMLTGSHNPGHYNGLKIVLGGKTLAGNDIQDLYQRIAEGNYRLSQDRGRLSEQNIVDYYIQRICGLVQLKRPLKVVIDCGNGVASIVAPQLFKSLGCEVVELYCEADGRFPNHHPDPSVPENLQDLIATVLSEKADLGLAFDGDADRLGAVTNEGQIIWPDRQMMLFARDILSRHEGATIIFDVKCSAELAHLITAHGGNPLMCQTGHSLVKAKMVETHALLAGELSGHIFFKERWYGFDDALYAGCRLLEILSQQTMHLSELFQQIPDHVNTPELRVSIAEEKKFSFMRQLKQQADFSDGKIITIDGLRVEYEQGWGLVRASNTSPYLILRFEAQDEAALSHIQAIFKQQLLSVDSELEIPY
ncbi:MAG: phosphomannomutase/phosphoglucomutase [Gammaproteobacteria bacterium]